MIVSALIIFFCVGLLFVSVFRDSIREAFGLTCRHGIPFDSYCIECQARRDRRG